MFHAAVRDLPAARQNWKMVIDSFPKAVGLELKTFRMSLLYFTASFDNINVKLKKLWLVFLFFHNSQVEENFMWLRTSRSRSILRL